MTIRSLLRIATLAFLAASGGLSADQATTGPTFPVSVWARVSFNGVPLHGAVLIFQRQDVKAPLGDSGPPAPPTVADKPGEYFVRVPGWGRYVVDASIEGRALPRKSVEITSRDLELAYTSGAVNISVEGRMPLAIASVVIRSGSVGLTADVAASDGRVRVLPLSFGSHRVLAFDSEGRVSRTLETVTLDEHHPEASVTIRLDEPAVVTLRDPKGRAASPLSITAWAGGTLRDRITSLGEGRFRLAGVPAGADLRIRPIQSEWLPQCRIVPQGDAFEIALTEGRRAEVSFTRLGVAGPAGTLSGVEGSDCPVPFNFFRFERLPPPADKSPRSLIQNFPFSNDLLFEYQGLSQSVTVNGDGSVIVR